MPNVPRTGHPPEGNVPAKPVVMQPAKPGAPGRILEYLPVGFRVFFDRNANSLFDLGEGIRGVSVFFVKHTGDRVALGSFTTSGEGYGTASLLQDTYRVVVPYFGLDLPMKDFFGRDVHKIWLPTLVLPDRVP